MIHKQTSQMVRADIGNTVVADRQKDEKSIPSIVDPSVLDFPIREQQQARPSPFNLILMMVEHGAPAISELDEEIDALDKRRIELVARRETIQRMVDIAIAHSNPKVINA